MLLLLLMMLLPLLPRNRHCHRDAVTVVAAGPFTCCTVVVCSTIPIPTRRRRNKARQDPVVDPEGPAHDAPGMRGAVLVRAGVARPPPPELS
jgi:hypothetical protein